MHRFEIPSEVAERVVKRRGKLHAYDSFAAATTALLVVDMQNAFVKAGAGHAYVATAASTCPNINRLAQAMRERGGTVVWILNTFTEESRDSWSHFHRELSAPAVFERRSETMADGHDGHRIYADLKPAEGDLFVKKTRYSAFIQGSSVLERILRSRGVDTVLITGTATNVCCESTGRDAMMLNFRSVMVSDACSAGSDADHAAALCSFIQNFGDVLATDEVITRLGANATARCAAE
ncbi:MAG: cysteine hydrolase [Alphaproteobacteria bacterium]|nr:cysteine hydrolase [Alphaproteobacteria bacterium]